MKIRARLTLWYAGILILSLLIMGAGTYQEIAEQMGQKHGARSWEDALDEAGEMVCFVGLPAIALGLLGGWWITRRAFAPIRGLTEAVEKIHEQNLKSQLPRNHNGDELDRLTEVFNAMTRRLDESFQRIREFALHASHELKTPLTIMRGELETILIGDAVTPVQKELLLNQIDEIERLAKIVDGLTLLTNADAGQVRLNFEELSFDELVRESVADAKILAQPHNIEVSLSHCDKTSLSGDRHRLRQLLLNLTDNAIKYNRLQGHVTISLRHDGRDVEFRIENTGPGLPAELQPRVFERFFRGDPSHNSLVDGCGLGLSIAQWITKAHSGSIQFVSEERGTTTVTVFLPRSV